MRTLTVLNVGAFALCVAGAVTACSANSDGGKGFGITSGSGGSGSGASSGRRASGQ